MLAYITYIIVTVIIGFVDHAANLAAAGTLVVGIECRLLAHYTIRFFVRQKRTIYFTDTRLLTAVYQVYLG